MSLLQDACQRETWEDVTEMFKDSVKELNLGELIKSDHLTLLQAMTAIELMDPRMDSGMILRQSNRKIYNFEQSIKLNLVKVNDIKYEELAGIIDETYSCLVTWFENHSLAQTVMTNLYLHDPERIEDRPLRVFSQSILRLVDFIDKLVLMVFCIEEEDFHCNVCKFKLADHLNDQKIITTLEDLCQHYESLILGRSEAQNPSSIATTQNNKPRKQIQSPTKLTASEKSQINAIISRLRFTCNFYNAFYIINKNIMTKDWELGPQAVSQITKIARSFQSSLANCEAHLDKCLFYLDKWRDTIDFGIKPKPRENAGSFEIDHPTIMGFDSLVNQKLLPPAYPRSPTIITRPMTLDYLRDLVLRLKECISISNCFNQKSLIKSIEAIERFSKYHKPNSCVISRSFLQTLYLPHRSVDLLRDEVIQSINSFTDPLGPGLSKEDDGSASAEILSCCSKIISQAIGIYGHNAARQHERLPDLIATLKNLQYSTMFDSNQVYLWTTFHLTRFSTKYILAGLELELYSPHEYPYVFWYLYEILYKTERDQLEQAKRSIFATISDDPPRKGKVKKQRKRNLSVTSFHDMRLVRNDALRLIAEGLFLLTHGLKLQGKIATPKMDHTSEAVCFEHRFGILSNTNLYFAYRETVESLVNLTEIYREALDRFTDAKMILESLGDAEYQDCLKVSKINMVVAKILSSNTESFKNKIVEFSFDIHPSFPTVKV